MNSPFSLPKDLETDDVLAQVPPFAALKGLISLEVDYLMEKWNMVIEAEGEIDPDETLYLITWSPDPSELPNADFNTQHLFNVNILSDFLSTVECGLFCVEASQLGSPHYHGWYQLSTDPIKEKSRLTYIKVMQRFSPHGLKITRSKGHYKIGSLVSQANCLYYYKKDLLQSMATIYINPICSQSRVDLDWNSHSHLFMKNGRQSVADIEDKITLKEFYKQFYENSLL